MPQLRFYHQQRIDGGVRAGIGIDNQPVLHRFHPGEEESDPALLWFVDVTVEGRGLPIDPDEARGWLLDNAQPIVRALRGAAERLEVGLDDTGAWPYRMQIESLPRGIRGELRISAVRSLAAGELGALLTQLANEWEVVLHDLSPHVPV